MEMMHITIKPQKDQNKYLEKLIIPHCKELDKAYSVGDKLFNNWLFIQTENYGDSLQ